MFPNDPNRNNPVKPFTMSGSIKSADSEPWDTDPNDNDEDDQQKAITRPGALRRPPARPAPRARIGRPSRGSPRMRPGPGPIRPRGRSC